MKNIFCYINCYAKLKFAVLLLYNLFSLWRTLDSQLSMVSISKYPLASPYLLDEEDLLRLLYERPRPRGDLLLLLLLERLDFDDFEERDDDELRRRPGRPPRCPRSRLLRLMGDLRPLGGDRCLLPTILLPLLRDRLLDLDRERL